MTNTQKVLKKYGVGDEKKSVGKDITLPMHAAVVSKVEEMTQRQGGESQTRSVLENYGVEPSAKGTSIATQKKADPFVRPNVNTQIGKTVEEDDPFIRAIINTPPYIAEEDLSEMTAAPYADSALFKAVARVRSGKSVVPSLEEVYAAAAQRVETPKPESRYQRGGRIYKEEEDPFIQAVINTQKEIEAAREDDPFLRAIINTQNSQGGKRTSAAVEYDLDTLNQYYDALWQEAEAWENQAVFQGIPEEMWEWERKAKAKRREAEGLLPKIDALQQELDGVKAAEKKEMMEQGGYREADLKDIIINSFKRGYLGAEQGKESYKEMMGEGSTRRAEYEELLAGEDYKFVPMHWWEEAISGASSQLGQQLSQAADPSTLALMGGFGGMAAAAGQAGPQVLVPEEVVTVPAALAAGFTAGSAMNNIKIEAGNSYNELLEHGVSESTARAIAGAVGGINGALESLQLDSLLNSFGILKSTGVSGRALDLIAEELKRRGLDIASNVTQEVLQEGATIAGTQLGTKMETGKWAYGAGEMADRLKDTAISSALTFSALNVPGTIRSIGSNLSAGRTVGNTVAQNGSMGGTRNLVPYSQHEAQNFLTGARNKVLGFGSDILEFAKRAISTQGGKERLYCGKLPPETADIIFQSTGYDLSEFNFVIPSDGVWHTYDHHGNDTEKTKGRQVSVRPEDMILLPEVIAHPDKVTESSHKDGHGRIALIFEKKMGDTVVTITGISAGRKVLDFDSMRIMKERSPAESHADGTIGPPLTS